MDPKISENPVEMFFSGIFRLIWYYKFVKNN